MKNIDFLKKNASKEYICNLDYSKELNEMNLKEETRGLFTIASQRKKNSQNALV